MANFDSTKDEEKTGATVWKPLHGLVRLGVMDQIEKQSIRGSALSTSLTQHSMMYTRTPRYRYRYRFLKAMSAAGLAAISSVVELPGDVKRYLWRGVLVPATTGAKSSVSALRKSLAVTISINRLRNIFPCGTPNFSCKEQRYVAEKHGERLAVAKPGFRLRNTAEK